MGHRSDWVDYAKAIGIILVVYAHVARGLYNAGLEIHEGFYVLVDSIVYSFVMPLFFFLSGMFFYDSFSKRGGIKLIGSKIDTIIYPFVLWSISQGMLEVSLSAYTNGNVTYSEVFSLLWAPRAHFWFLYALFVAFLLASAIFSIVPKKASIAVSLFAALAYISASTMPEIFVVNVMAHHFVFFALGIVFTTYFKAENLSDPWLLGLFTSAFLIGQFIFHGIFGLGYQNYGVASLLLAIVSIVFVISLSTWLALKPNRLMVFIGSSSMAIYLMHVLAGGATRVLLEAMGVESFFSHLIIGSLAGLFVPLFILVLMSKLRIRYIFSAPISRFITFSYQKLLHRPDKSHR
ncbi:MAG: acyltransferase [Nitrosomonadales bacterium]|nr:acyltransferase [Nitrosomonadales bacterium]